MVIMLFLSTVAVLCGDESNCKFKNNYERVIGFSSERKKRSARYQRQLQSFL
jgi:transcriptional regulator GlxA family with amidase domain